MKYFHSDIWLVLFIFADDGPAQFVQAVGKAVEPLFHTQQQIPAQYHRETEVRGSAEKFFGIHLLPAQNYKYIFNFGACRYVYTRAY